MFVLVQQAAETVTPVDVQPGELVRISDRFRQRNEWPGVGDALVRSVRIVEDLVLTQRVQEMALAFMRGIRTPLCTTVIPLSARIGSNSAGYFPSRSRMR